MPTVDDISSQIRSILAVTEPDLDTTIGTTVRKIIDANAEAVAEAYLDNYLLGYQYDIDSRTGSDLDDFVAVFGFARYPAKRATGTVTFAIQNPSSQNFLIPLGTQIATTGSPSVVFSTVVPALLAAGQITIDVPVQAVLGGSAGNVASNAIQRRVTPLDGITSLSNILATTGGVDVEGDTALRQRFKTTVFRSLAGTEQMFLGTALADPDVTQANVLGASKTHREQIQLVSGTATSTVQNATYVYDSPTFGVNIDAGQLLTENVHFTFNAGVIPPTVTSIDSVNVPDGIYDLEFEYVPAASRNVPSSGITNRIDIYVNGMRTAEATEQLLFSNTKTFNTTGGDPLNRLNFQRIDGSNPTTGNYFIKFTFTPVVDPGIADTIVINGITYVEGTDYYLINDVTNQGGTAKSNSGIEFKSVANGLVQALPANGTHVQLDYTYNTIPRDVEIAIRNWRLVSTDVKVHAAKRVLLNLNMAIILTPGYSLAAVQTPLFTAISNYINNIGFDGVVQVSDLLQVAHNVPGVDAARFLTSADNGTTYGIQHVAADGTTILSNYNNGGTPLRAIDVYINDDSLPVLNVLNLIVKAQNTFGTV